MTPEQARTAVSESLLRVAPEAELDRLGWEEDLREALDLDSLDFQAFLAELSARSGHRIDEEDYGRLSSMAGCVRFLTGR
ncbi:phosphopantetheine-binding protein [Allokutzneria oryzae]|uniref:Phosphopantetheine-binding protein n=1 Tax=Allokutzneria oryzae TaxID=1378989 RepID=A0ABV5ZWX7_9PSEU